MLLHIVVNYKIIGESLEELQKGLKHTNIAPYLHDIVSRITQLTYIVDNETRLLKQSSDKLLDQVESSKWGKILH